MRVWVRATVGRSLSRWCRRGPALQGGGEPLGPQPLPIDHREARAAWRGERRRAEEGREGQQRLHEGHGRGPATLRRA